MRGVKGKSKKPKPTKPDNPAQSARFIAAAKSLGLSGHGKEFERAITAISHNKVTKD